MNLKLYLSSLLDVAILMVASLADLEMEIRVAVALVGVVLSIMTGIKLVQQIRHNAMENRIKEIELRRKEEEDRLYFEQLHK
jgi:hypothetical protein